MGSFPKGNDRRAPRNRPLGVGAKAARRDDQAGGPEWIWGRHAVDAAVANPRRTGLRRLLSAPGKAAHLEAGFGARGLRIERLEAHEIGRMLPAGAVHQGLALLADPLAPVELDELAEPPEGVLLLLDQVADPQNVGAILRSAAAFGARGLILQERRAPALSGALAKAPAGGLGPRRRAPGVDLSRALETLAARGWRTVGLAGEAEARLDQAFDGAPVVLVLGSEGEGLRRLVSEHCDVLAAIPMPGGFESLNVATAAAIALYEAARSRRTLE